MAKTRSVKEQLLWLSLLPAIVIGLAIFAPQPPDAPPQPFMTKEQQDNALAYLRKKATYLRDATWSGATLYASMLNKRGSENGYAMTTCEYLQDIGADKGVTVRIMDAQVLMATRKWVEIGKNTCGQPLGE